MSDSPVLTGDAEMSTLTPTIAAVEGYALGDGCELAMACDFVVAGQSATFGQPEIRVGLVPGAGGLSRLIQRAGRARALRMVLTGEPISAYDAIEIGIVSDIVADGEALKTVTRLATTIAAQPPLNVRAIRKVARHAEGIAAFIAKRRPEYEGR